MRETRPTRFAIFLEPDDVTEIFRSLRSGDCASAIASFQRIADNQSNSQAREAFEVAKYNVRAGMYAVDVVA